MHAWHFMPSKTLKIEKFAIRHYRLFIRTILLAPKHIEAILVINNGEGKAYFVHLRHDLDFILGDMVYEEFFGESFSGETQSSANCNAVIV